MQNLLTEPIKEELNLEELELKLIDIPDEEVENIKEIINDAFYTLYTCIQE